LRHYQRESVKVGVFQGVGHFGRKFQVEGDIAHQPLLVSEVIALSCGTKISAVCTFVLSQSTRVTDGETEKQNYNCQKLASIAASRGKNL